MKEKGKDEGDFELEKGEVRFKHLSGVLKLAVVTSIGLLIIYGIAFFIGVFTALLQESP
jgi:hypothetical protein